MVKAKEKKDEVIGFHKGSLQTLVNERAELLRLIQIVDSLIRAHIKELEKLGIDIKKEFEKAKTEK